MYLSSRKTRVLSKVLLFLTEPGQEHEIRTRIGSLLLDLLDADYYASYVWAHDENRFGGRVAVNMSDSNLKSYEDYYQFHDPITPQLQIRREPTLVTQIMPQQELKRTEFFNDFLHRDGLYWGVNLYAWTGDQNIGDMRIWRGKRRSNFDENDLHELAVKGLSDKEIAARLGICFTTVRTHIDSAFQKLHVNNRVKLGRIFTGRAD